MLIEPQLNTVAEVARAKAREAYNSIGNICIVEDTGFEIDELAGFPGPYTRYITETIGLEGVMRLASPLTNRTCSFISALVLSLDYKQTELFTATISGRLASNIGSGDTGKVWSPLVQAFIPHGYNQCLSEFTDEEFKSFMAQMSLHSTYVQCVQWITTNLV